MSLKIKFVTLGMALCLLTPKSFANLPESDDSVGLDAITQGVVMVFDEYGHEVPFPRSAVILFPWEFIEGYWVANIGEVAGVFQFKIDVTDPTRKRLRVSYMDRQTSQLLAQGFGTMTEDQQSVHAYIEGPGLSAVITVTAYKLSVQGVTKTEVVTSIQTKDSAGPAGANNYVIRKLR